jgi:hypothetical protein
VLLSEDKHNAGDDRLCVQAIATIGAIADRVNLLTPLKCGKSLAAAFYHLESAELLKN